MHCRTREPRKRLLVLAKPPGARYHDAEAFAGRWPDRIVWSAAIAQLVEHVIRNDGVTGSSPVCGTKFFFVIRIILERFPSIYWHANTSAVWVWDGRVTSID
jgi:hypothetical protein